MEKSESVPQADHIAWILLILIFSALLSLIGWGVTDLVLPTLLPK